MIRIGITGSIGMGKSTTARLFAEEGIPVNDADQVVHQLYADEAVEAISEAFPESIVDGVVDRTILSGLLAKNPASFRLLEKIVHPLVLRQEQDFLETWRQKGAKLVVLDIPLLFETGAIDRVDKIVVVTCDDETQRKRVMERPGMTEEKFGMILARQMPDAEKRRRADFIIDTGQGIADARDQVKKILRTLRGD